jgi:hypothetical protein
MRAEKGAGEAVSLFTGLEQPAAVRPLALASWVPRLRSVSRTTTSQDGPAWGAHVCLTLLAAVLLYVGPHHRAWFDEAQAWLIARDASPWTILTTIARHEGSPALWHLLLWGVQRAGLPYALFWTVSAALCLAGAAIVLYRAPFPLWLRAGVAFSYFVAYQFALVARSYALDVLLLPAIAAAWSGRRERPLVYALLLALLANTNAHAFILAAALAAQFAWDLRSVLFSRREVRPWLAVLLYGFLGLAAAAQAWPSADVRFALAERPEPVRALILFKEALIDRADILSFHEPRGPSELIGLVLSLAAFVPFVLLCWRARLGGALLGGLGGVMLFSGYKYADAWHAGLVFLYLVTLLWMAWPARASLTGRERAGLAVSLGAVMLCQDIGSLQAWRTELRAAPPYSGAPAAARAIGAQLAAHPGDTVGALGPRAIAVQPWLLHNIFSNHAQGAPGQAYYLWSTAEEMPQAPSPALWRALLARRYDLLVLGELRSEDGRAVGAYDDAAEAAGYRCIGVFPGRADWRGYPGFDDSLYLYARTGTARSK